MTVITRQRLPLILTGVLVMLAIAAAAVFFATGSSTPVAAPTPAQSPGGSSEMLPPTATPTTPSLGIPAAPLITEPLPESASAKGILVEGFPLDIISLPAGAEVVSSAIATEGQRMQATVVATTPATDAEVQSYFQGIFAPLGLASAATPSGPGTTAATYSLGSDSIIVATTTEASGTRFSIFALFTAAQA